MGAIREWLRGKKSYLVGVGAIVAAVLGFAEGEIELPALVAAITAAIMAMTIRAGIAKV